MEIKLSESAFAENKKGALFDAIKKHKQTIFIFLLAVIIFLLPGVIFRTLIYLFDDLHNDSLAAVVWFFYLGIRLCACAILIYLSFQSFRRKKVLLKLYFIVFLLLETAFSFYTDSNGMISFATANWHCWYWHPVNKLGYHDRELQPDSLCQHKIVTVGDSYTAGYALEDINSRFDYLLQSKLGKGWCTYCAAQPGMDTKEEFTRLKKYPVSGNYIVFGYYINDMDSVLFNRGLGFPDPPEVTYGLHPLVTASSVFNFLFFKYGYLFHDNPDYYKFMKESYNNADALKEHYGDLKKIIDFASASNAHLIVVIFPELNDLEVSNEIYVAKMTTFFQQYPLTVINVSDLVKNIPVQERFASNTDTHPGVKVQQPLADTLFKVIKGIEQIEKK